VTGAEDLPRKSATRAEGRLEISVHRHRAARWSYHNTGVSDSKLIVPAFFRLIKKRVPESSLTAKS